MKQTNFHRLFYRKQVSLLFLIQHMRILQLMTICTLASINFNVAIAQDTLAYEIQRKKVNDLLSERSQRFDQYSQSLQKKTGIFGLKTKKDMQASIDILKELVLTDNNIFKETKVLVDYKDMEKTFITNQAQESESRINGYVKTISKLQKDQDAQKKEIDSLEKKAQINFNLFLASLVSTIILAYIFIKKTILKKHSKYHR